LLDGLDWAALGGTVLTVATVGRAPVRRDA
jgi:hypothetical protein